MPTEKSIIQSTLDINEFQSGAITAHEDHTINYSGAHFWQNDDLYADSNNVPTETKTHFHLKQAEDNSTLESIQSYHNPLVFTSNSDKIKVRCWDIARIEFLSREGSAVEARDHNEYEVWIRSSSSRFESNMNSILEDIEDLE